MKINRRGRSEDPWRSERTDSKEPSQYIQEWKNAGGPLTERWAGGSITFKATKKKEPQRSSEVELVIGEDDVFALFNALLERMGQEENRLRAAMWEIHELLFPSLSARSASPSDLILKAREIVDKALEGRRKTTAQKSQCPNWNPFRIT